MKDSRILKEELLQGNYEELFREIYQDDSEAKRQNARYAQAVEKFEELFGEKQVEIYSAPGRSEVGGNHTDHQHGMVLATSINLDAVAVVSPVDSPVIQLVSEGYDMVEVDTRDLEEKYEEEGTTTALIRGAAAALTEKGYKIGGFQAYITSDVLIGAGLSSSAAFEVIVGTILSGLFNNMEIDPVEIAKAGQYAENVYFGKPCGLLDQSGISLGGINKIDFKDPSSPEIESLAAPEGYTLVITNTGGSHAALTEHYAAIKTEMHEVANFFGKQFLRDVKPEKFYAEIPALRKKVSERAILRACHFYEENERVDAAAAALKSGNTKEFLAAVEASGKSSLNCLQNCFVPGSSEQPVTLALHISDRIVKDGAVRVHGGGFAGTILAYLADAETEGYVAEMGKLFGSENVFTATVRKPGAIRIAPEELLK